MFFLEETDIYGVINFNKMNKHKNSSNRLTSVIDILQDKREMNQLPFEVNQINMYGLLYRRIVLGPKD